MLEFIGNLLSGDGNFTNIATFIGIYLILLWLAFCAWVYADAMKRYDNSFLAIVWFVAVLILNFPALIFYFVVRPDREDENILFIKDNGSSTTSEGGVNIPLVNFVGEEGVAISFQLKINKSSLDAESALSNMKIDVGFDNQTESFQPAEQIKTNNSKSTKIEESDSFGTSEEIDTVQSAKERWNVSKFKSAGRATYNKFSALKNKIKLPQQQKNAIEVEISTPKAEIQEQTKTPKQKNKKKKFR